MIPILVTTNGQEFAQFETALSNISWAQSSGPSDGFKEKNQSTTSDLNPCTAYGYVCWMIQIEKRRSSCFFSFALFRVAQMSDVFVGCFNVPSQFCEKGVLLVLGCSTKKAVWQ